LNLERFELADIHAPDRLARKVHEQIGKCDGPVPVDDIAYALDITEVRREALDGMEGMLLTDTARTTGAILVNNVRGLRRARFSIAHELGHFLMERHVLSSGAGFGCTADDMNERRVKARHHRQETEANAFAIGLLAPSYKLAPAFATDPDLKDLRVLSRDLDISMEALVRRYVSLADEALCAVWTYQGKVRTTAKGKSFPWLPLTRGDALPKETYAQERCISDRPGTYPLVEANALAWLGKPDVELFEQTQVGQSGYALTLLWASLPDEEDDTLLAELGMPKFP
jgi:hypothetical protein